jgi:hypothetical protein
MPTPSLILVPARFKTGKLYTPLATTSGGVVLGASGDFNVTRATTATRVNANGLIESVASGIPRLDYYTSGGTAGCPALLVEASGSNIMAQSENLSNSIEWSPTSVNVTGSAIASPDGLASGTLLVATSGNAQHNINKNATTSITSGTTITASCFFKAHGTNTFVQIAVGGFTFSPASPFANFNLSGNGAITTGTYSSAFIQNYGNGWYRCGLTATAAANGTNNIAIVPIIASGTGRNTTFAGDGVNGVYAWGVQVETGSVATSYIPTTAAAVTRNADAINVTGAVSGCIGQTQGTLYAEFRYLGPPTLRAGFITLRNASFRGFSINAPSNLGIRFESRNNAGTSTVVLTNTLNIGDYYKIAIAYDTGGTAAGGTQASGVTAYVNGSPATVAVGDLRVPDTALNEVRLYGAVTSTETETPNGNLRSAAFYTTRLTNDELAALTTL